MATNPVAVHAEAANAQHYEVPAEFFGLVLGPRRKYSSCLYEGGAASLAEAELEALEATAANASLSDGQSILELGCGWGSLSLFMAETMPKSTSSPSRTRTLSAPSSRPKRSGAGSPISGS